MIHGNTNLPSQSNSLRHDGKLSSEVGSMNYRTNGTNGLLGSNDSSGTENNSKTSPNNSLNESTGKDTSTRNQIQLEKNIENMVPVSFVFKRFAAISLQERNNLTTLLPSKRRTDKKKHLMNFTTKNKFRTLKAQHLLKWSRASSKIQEAQSLVALAQKEIDKIHNTVGSINDIGRSLRQDRVENYDVLSAIDIYSSGTFKQVPSIIKESFVPPAKLEEPQINSALLHLNDFMFLRYLKTESIPSCLQDGIKIDDGKFYLTFKKHYEIILTLLGPSMELPWHLVSIKVLISGDKSELNSSVETTLAPHQYNLLFKTAQQMLLPPHLREDFEPPQDTPEVSVVNPQDSNPNGKTPYIELLHNYLYSFCQGLQLEILFSQAYILASHRWKEQLLVEMDADRSSLKLKYWSKFIPLSFMQKSGTHDRDNSHYLLISKGEDFEEQLKVGWSGFTIDALQSKLRQEDTQLFTASEKELLLDPTCLNIEAILLKLIKLHSKIILVLLRNHLTSFDSVKTTFGISNTLQNIDISFVETDPLSMYIQLSRIQKLRFSIDFRSGRAKIYMNNEHGNEVRLLELEKEINNRPEEIKTIIIEWRIKRVLESIRISAVLLGLDYTFKLPLHPSDLNKFGMNIQRLLYLSLPKCDNNYLVVGLVDLELKFWHVALLRKSNIFSIVQMTFLNQDLIQKVLDDSGTLSHESMESSAQDNRLLDSLLKLCQGYHLSSTIEEQFIRCGLGDYFKLPPVTCSDSAVTHSFQKSLHRSLGLLTNSESSTGSNVSLTQLFSIPLDCLNSLIAASTPFVTGPVQVFVSHPQTQWIAFSFHLCLAQLPSVTGLKLPIHWVFDEINDKVASLTIAYKDFSSCVDDFRNEWLSFVISTKLHLEISKLPIYPVLSYDMQTLTVSYHEYYSLTIGWVSGLNNQTNVPPGVDIQLHSSHPQRFWNPQLRIQAFLVNMFNETFSLSKVLDLCKLSLPVLLALDDYERRCFRPVNVIALSATSFKLVYSPNSSIDLLMVSSARILIRDGFSGHCSPRQVPCPWRLASNTNQITFHLKPAANAWFSLYAPNLSHIVRRFSDRSLTTRQFFHSREGVFCDSDLTLPALLGLDWIYTILCVFQRAYTVNFKEQKSFLSCSNESDLIINHTTPSGGWILKTKDNLSSLVFEPTGTSGSPGPALSEDLSLLSTFFINKINVIGQLSSVTFHAAYSLTHCPVSVLHDLAETLRLMNDPASKGLTEESLKIDWYLVMPSSYQFSNAGLPRSGAPVSVYSPKDNILKILFSIRRAETILALPLQFNGEPKTLSYCHVFFRDPNGNAPMVQRQALSNLILKADRELPADLKISGLIQHIAKLPLHDFRFAASS